MKDCIVWILFANISPTNQVHTGLSTIRIRTSDSVAKSDGNRYTHTEHYIHALSSVCSKTPATGQGTVTIVSPHVVCLVVVVDHGARHQDERDSLHFQHRV